MRIGYDLKDKPCLFLLTLVYTKKNPIHVLQTKKREMITCQILTLSLRESDENGPTIDIYINTTRPISCQKRTVRGHVLDCNHHLLSLVHTINEQA